MCHNSCAITAVCPTSLFYNCTSCTNPLVLQTNVCVTTPNYIIQMAFTLSIILFLIPQILHLRRFMILTKIFDFMQIVYYFKYLTIYEPYRHQYLYLGFRSWGAWSQGWRLLNLDTGLGVWLGEQGDIDRSIRIFSVIGGIFGVTILIGLYKLMTQDKNFTWNKYYSKNWKNCLILAIYVVAQDMGLVIANQFYLNSSTAFTFSSSSKSIEVVCGIIFTIILICIIFGEMYIINNLPDQHKDQEQNFFRSNMFIFAYQFDKFTNFQKLNETQVEQNKSNNKSNNNKNQNIELLQQSIKQKKFNYSNLRILSLLFKIIYPFLIIYQINGNYQINAIAGLFIFFEIPIWIVFPFKAKKQYLSIAILALGQLLTIILLYLYGSGNLGQYETLALCLSFFFLALISVLIQIFYDYYILIPVDLYQIGQKIQINILNPEIIKQKDHLQKEKKRLQQQMATLEQLNKKRLKQMDQEDKAKQQLRLKKQKQLEAEIEKLRRQKQNTENQKNKKEMQLKQKQLKAQRERNMTEQEAQIEKRKKVMEDQLLQRYKINLQNISPFTWDKNKKFVYTHKIDY